MEKSLILNSQNNTVYKELLISLQECKSFYFNAAFINYEGLQLFLGILDKLDKLGVTGNVLTSTYLNFTDPKALRKLKTFQNVNLKVYQANTERGFHSKAYIFEYAEEYKIIIGSSNITASALKRNIEWNVRIMSKKEDPFILNVLNEFNFIWNKIEIANNTFLDQYENFITFIKAQKKGIAEFDKLYFQTKDVEPNQMQEKAIVSLNKLRMCGENKGLVIAATGTGKTYMSAFDVKQVSPKRLLFVVHKGEILKKAEEAFKNVLGATISTGFLTGDEKVFNKKYMFATIQTLHKYLALFNPNDFDYIVIDEAHHIAGETYQKVLQYFQPTFLLGMTATPERCDNFNIFDAFDNNVAVNIRLHEAMEAELVTPFHYFGITDIEEANLENVNIDNLSDVAKHLKVHHRVDFIIEKMNLYEHDGDKRKCLGFCVNKDHGNYMCSEFEKRGIKSVFLSGDDATEDRICYINMLEDENDPLEVIFTIDIFNEGIDIPSINLVLMLRPTTSPIIFIQQLGRGLRKYEGKNYLTVLDFIGNHNRAFLIAIALKGSRYYNKDSLKVSVSNEFIDIPGNTFIQMDEVSKERIIQQLDQENFNSMRYLKEEYLSFKALLSGRIPRYLMDYLNYEGAPDPMRFIHYKKTYIQFINSVEKLGELNAILLDDNFVKAMSYISAMLPIKRPYEFAILLELLKRESLSFKEAKDCVLKYMVLTVDDTVKHAMEYLSFQFYDKKQKNKWISFVAYEERKLFLHPIIKMMIKDELKKKYICDVIYYGLSIYQSTFEDKNYGLPFLKLYAEYSMQDIALMSNVRNQHSSFRGSGLLTSENNYFLFVNLNKKEDVKKSQDYKDVLIDDTSLQWQSQNDTKQTSDRGKNIIYNIERGVILHLFVRKFSEIDKQVQPYIYLGKANTEVFKGEKPITVKLKLENRIPSFLYIELTSNIKKDSSSPTI